MYNQGEMECAYHPNRRAVGICSVCNRHICAECKTTLIDRVICYRCKLTVTKRFKEKLNMGVEKETQDSMTDYIMPVGAILLAIMFFVIFSLAGMREVMFIPAILLGIGIILLIPVVAYHKRKSKQTQVQRIGWILVGGGIVYFVIGLPILGILFELGAMFIVASLLISIVVIFIGMKLTKV